MADTKNLDSWAEKLLDIGKRNNLINFKDTKSSSAEVLFPECEAFFSKCSIGRTFEVYDPQIADDDELEDDGDQPIQDEEKKLSRSEYKDFYAPRIRGERLLVYALTPNPLTAVKNIAKKAKEAQDETGINVAYLAFGFVNWKEDEKSDIFYRAPLLLVHVNIITKSLVDPIKIEISDDDVVVNPTFSYKLKSEYGITLPNYEDDDTLESYFSKVSKEVEKLGWEILNECKLGIFSFLKINMYEDLKNNETQILKNNNVQILLGNPSPVVSSDSAPVHVVENPLIDLHTVVDADSSQIEAIEMAKSGKSFVLQGPPGTGKSQTITNIIAECLHDGKKVLFVSEKQAALNVVYDKLKKADLADFCLELHSHKANKKAVIEELNRTLELSKSGVKDSAQYEIREKQDAQRKLDSYEAALHKKRDPVEKSLYQLFEQYSACKKYPEIQYLINNIQARGQEYFIDAVRLLEQYSEYTHSVGQDFRRNAWFGCIFDPISPQDKNSFKSDLEALVQGFEKLQSTTASIKNRYETPELNFSDTVKWQNMLAFASKSDVVTPSLLSRDAYDYALPHLEQMQKLSETIVPARKKLLESFESAALQEYDGKELTIRLSGEFKSFFTRLFSKEYKNLIAGIRLHYKRTGKLKYKQVAEFADQLKKLQSETAEYTKAESAISGCLGSCYRGPDSDWGHIMGELDDLQRFLTTDQSPFCIISKMSKSSFTKNQKVFRVDADRLDKEMKAVDFVKNRIQPNFSSAVLDLKKHRYEYCIRKLKACLAEFDKLDNWIDFRKLLGQLKRADLLDFVGQVIEKQIDPQMIPPTFRKVFYRNWIEYIFFSTPELRMLSRIAHDQAVQNFKEKDASQYEISKAQIKSELS